MPRKRALQRANHIAYILGNIGGVVHDDKLLLLKHLMGLNIKIHEAGDGCRINLDLLTNAQVKKIHDIIKEAIDAVKNNPELYLDY